MQLDAWQQSLLKELDNHLVRSAFDLTVDRPESLRKLGDILCLPHSQSYEVCVCFGDDPVSLKLLQEGVSELPSA